MAWDPTQWTITIPELVSVEEFNAYIRPTQKVPIDYQQDMVAFALRQATQYLNTFLNNKIVDTIDNLDPTSDRDKARVQHLKMAVIYTAEYFLTNARVFASIQQSISGSTPFSIQRDSFTAIVESERPDIVNELNAGGWISTFYAKPLSTSTQIDCEGHLSNWVMKYLNSNYLPLYDATKHPMMSDIDMNGHTFLNWNLPNDVYPTWDDLHATIHDHNFDLAAHPSIHLTINQIWNARVQDSFSQTNIKGVIDSVNLSLSTKSYVIEFVNQRISEAQINTFKYKGKVNDISDLPTTNNSIGDVYYVATQNSFYAWDGTKWDQLSGSVGAITSIQAGQDIQIDNTNPAIPVISVDRNYQNTTFANKSSNFLTPITETNKGLTQADYVDLINQLKATDQLVSVITTGTGDFNMSWIPQEYRTNDYRAEIRAYCGGMLNHDSNTITIDAGFVCNTLLEDANFGIPYIMRNIYSKDNDDGRYNMLSLTPDGTTSSNHNINFIIRYTDSTIWGHSGKSWTDTRQASKLTLQEIRIYKKGTLN